MSTYLLEVSFAYRCAPSPRGTWSRLAHPPSPSFDIFNPTLFGCGMRKQMFWITNTSSALRLTGVGFPNYIELSSSDFLLEWPCQS